MSLFPCSHAPLLSFYNYYYYYLKTVNPFSALRPMIFKGPFIKIKINITLTNTEITFTNLYTLYNNKLLVISNNINYLGNDEKLLN